MRFHFNSSAAVTADGWSIDNFKIYVPKFHIDAEMNSITAPVNSTTTGDSVSVSIEVSNNGKDSLINIPVNYEINGMNIVTEIIYDTLAPYDTVQYTFNQKYFALNTDYSICAFTSVANEMNTGNDSLCSQITSSPANYDIGISQILSPVNSASINGHEVIVRVHNYGLNDVNNILIDYYVQGQSMIITDTIQSLISGDSIDFKFTKDFNPPLGTIVFCVETKYPADQYPDNDKLCEAVTGSGINESNDLLKITNSPNPFDSRTTFEIQLLKPAKLKFSIVNSLGKLVMHEDIILQSGKTSLTKDFSHLPAGVYYYTFENQEMKVSSKMLIIK